MDLPSEVRLSIYQYIPLELCFTVYEQHWTPGSMPSLLSCCKQIRQEALPLASIRLEIEAYPDVFESAYHASDPERNWAFRNFGKQLYRWALWDGDEFVKSLSKLTLRFSEICDECDACQGSCHVASDVAFEIEFVLRPSQGLIVRRCRPGHVLEDDGPLKPTVMEDIRKAISDLELQRRSCGLYGEVFVMLISDCLPTWAFLNWK
jgi:hypothetical protein